MAHRLPTQTRQAAIVAAALRLASESSPAAVSTSDIAEAVGVSQGALFKHFPSKAAIWLAALRWVHTTLLEAVDQAIDDASDPLDAIQQVWRTHIGFVTANPGVPRLLFQELQEPNDSPLKETVRELMTDYLQRLVQLFRQARDQQQLRPTLDVEAAATMLLGTIQGLVMQSMLHRHGAVLQAQAERVFALYLSAIRESA
jgi:TetR/AcrR family transcriptional regulator